MQLLFISLWLGFVWVCTLPTLIITVALMTLFPEDLKKFLFAPKKSAAPVHKSTNIEYEFHTYKDMQERATRGMFKEGFENDPNWQKNRDAIDAIRMRNKRQNDAELAKEIAENANKTAQTAF